MARGYLKLSYEARPGQREIWAAFGEYYRHIASGPA